jgi:hypothetical protein
VESFVVVGVSLPDRVTGQAVMLTATHGGLSRVL